MAAFEKLFGTILVIYVSKIPTLVKIYALLIISSHEFISCKNMFCFEWLVYLINTCPTYT